MSYNQNQRNQPFMPSEYERLQKSQGNPPQQGQGSFPEPRFQNQNSGNNYNQQGNQFSELPKPNFNQGQNNSGSDHNYQQSNYHQNQGNHNQSQGQNHQQGNQNQGQGNNYQQDNQNYSQGRPIENYQPPSHDAPFNFKSRDGMFVGEVNGQQIALSGCNGNKKALLIGINYFNSKAELRGCINDVKNIADLFLPRFNFKPENVTILTDDQENSMRIPTYDNIIGAMKWLVQGARAGDSLFLHYSGHGGTVKDLANGTDGDEADGFDETILPVDYETKQQINDDTLFDVLVRDLPSGVRLTAVFDSCHSGSVLDLPFTYSHDGSIEVVAETDSGKEMAMSLLKAGLTFSQGDQAGALSLLVSGFRGFLKRKGKSQQQLNVEKKQVVADVIQFSGCKDDQTSADSVIDSRATGAMSHALCKVIKENPNQSYLSLLNNLRQVLQQKNFSQIPQISTGYAMDINNPFFL